MGAVQEDWHSGYQNEHGENECADWISDYPVWPNLDENGGTDNSDGLNHISKDVDDSRPDVQVLLTLLFLVFPGFFFYLNVLSYCFHVT